VLSNNVVGLDVSLVGVNDLRIALRVLWIAQKSLECIRS